MSKKTHLIVMIMLAFIVLSCSSNKQNEINVTIPPEIQDNQSAIEVIVEYQNTVNKFNTLAAKMLDAAGIEMTDTMGRIQLTEEDLSVGQMIKMGYYGLKQSKLASKFDVITHKADSIALTLNTTEKVSFLRVIKSLDNATGRFGDSTALNTENPTNEELLAELETKVNENPDPELDEETREMMLAREQAIQHQKDVGEWEEPEPSESNSTSPIVGILFTVLVILLIIGIFVFAIISFIKKGKGLLQKATHITGQANEAFNNLETDNPNMSADERKKANEARSAFSSLLGAETKKTSEIPGQSELSDSGKIVSHKDLRSLYDTELKGSLATMEKLRKSTKKWMVWAILTFIACYMAYKWLPSVYSLNIIAGIITLIAGFLLFFRGISKFMKYRGGYKKEVVEKVVRLINPSYLYSANKHISLNDFNKSKFSSTSANKCLGDDYVCGKIENTVFEFSELVAQTQTVSTNSKGEKETYTLELFNGLFFHADFNKHIQGETFIVPDNLEKRFGKFAQRFQKSSKGELVKLENPEFEKFFAVFSTSQTEARYILTPTMMEAMVNIRKKIDSGFFFSFVGERVHCGINFNKALFEPKIMKPVSFADVEFMHSLFSLIETIITEMNLNTRIWTKE